MSIDGSRTNEFKYFTIVDGKKSEVAAIQKHLESLGLKYVTESDVEDLSRVEFSLASEDAPPVAKTETTLVIKVLSNRAKIMNIIRKVFSCILTTSAYLDGGVFKNKVELRSKDILEDVEKALEGIAGVVLPTD